jgi:hypothetical protein
VVQPIQKWLHINVASDQHFGKSQNAQNAVVVQRVKNLVKGGPRLNVREIDEKVWVSKYTKFCKVI